VTSALTVANQLTINLDAAGTAAPHLAWPAKNVVVKVQSGVKLIFHNADTISHEIHGDGGIPHEPGALAAGADYVINAVTSDGDWYCHDHESGTQARLLNVL
jgi:hypothetical protein